MLNTQPKLFLTSVNPRPSHDTIAWNTVTVKGLNGQDRAFRLYGKVRRIVVECDTVDHSIVLRVNRRAGYQRFLGLLTLCRICGGKWHVDALHAEGFYVTPALSRLAIAESFPTRAEAVRAFAERYIAAGN